MASLLKKTEGKLVLADINMLLMIKKRIRGGKCHAIHRYAKANNKWVKNYDKNKESSYFQYLQFVWMGNVSKIICRWF